MAKNAPALADTTLHFGVILKTERFEDCLEFYRDRLGLPVWFRKEGLCCMRFGDGYLMVERGGAARDSRKTSQENPTVLRFNVSDVQEIAQNLRSCGIDVEIKSFNWGVIGVFADPDGNLCELKDAGDPYFVRSTSGANV